MNYYSPWTSHATRQLAGVEVQEIETIVQIAQTTKIFRERTLEAREGVSGRVLYRTMRTVPPHRDEWPLWLTWQDQAEQCTGKNMSARVRECCTQSLALPRLL